MDWCACVQTIKIVDNHWNAQLNRVVREREQKKTLCEDNLYLVRTSRGLQTVFLREAVKTNQFVIRKK